MSEPIEAQFVNKHDGHGAQFEIHFKDGLTRLPPAILAGIKSELASGATLYVDGARVEDGDLIISLCRGSILLADVQHYHNNDRKDGKFHVVMREELDSDEEPNLPRFVA